MAVGDWYRPTGYSDPNGYWSQQANAYDNSTSTYASNNTSEVDVKWLELTFTEQYIDSVSVLFLLTPSGLRGRAEVYYGAAWHDLGELLGYSGGNPVLNTFTLSPAVLASKVRVRRSYPCYNSEAGEIHDVQFRSAAPPSTILKVSGVARASISKVAGVAIASVNKVSGVQN